MTVPASYSLRRPVLADAEAVVRLVNAAEAEESGEQMSADDLLDDWRRVDLAADAWLVTADGGEPAGYVELARRGDDRVQADGYVHPAHTGRGVGAALLALTERRARELVPGGLLHNATLASNAAACRLFEARGYRSVRHFLRLAIELDGPPPEPRWPEGIEARAFELEQARAFHAAMEEAFSDHWNAVPLPFETFRERWLESDRFDPRLWRTAWGADEVAGTPICDRERFGRGWIAEVAVRRPWRGRGLGEALVRWALAEFWRRGERRVALGVDAENTTGATRLYERVGMHVVFDAVVYAKELVP